jgi:hypothetical protein
VVTEDLPQPPACLMGCFAVTGRLDGSAIAFADIVVIEAAAARSRSFPTGRALGQVDTDSV